MRLSFGCLPEKDRHKVRACRRHGLLPFAVDFGTSGGSWRNTTAVARRAEGIDIGMIRRDVVGALTP
jgi:hypothetical protein